MSKLITHVPLIIEQFPPDYDGYQFVSLIKYNDTVTLNIVDNIQGKNIHAYVLDLCGPENVDYKTIIQVAQEWHNNSTENYPISVEFSKIGLTNYTNKILRSYPVDFVTRVIGHVSEFPMTGVREQRRRRRTKNAKYLNKK